jgi:hypothetical protein
LGSIGGANIPPLTAHQTPRSWPRPQTTAARRFCARASMRAWAQWSHSLRAPTGTPRSARCAWDTWRRCVWACARVGVRVCVDKNPKVRRMCVGYVAHVCVCVCACVCACVRVCACLDKNPKTRQMCVGYVATGWVGCWGVRQGLWLGIYIKGWVRYGAGAGARGSVTSILEPCRRFTMCSHSA